MDELTAQKKRDKYSKKIHQNRLLEMKICIRASVRFSTLFAGLFLANINADILANLTNFLSFPKDKVQFDYTIETLIFNVLGNLLLIFAISQYVIEFVVDALYRIYLEKWLEASIFLQELEKR